MLQGAYRKKRSMLAPSIRSSKMECCGLRTDDIHIHHPLLDLLLVNNHHPLLEARAPGLM